MIRLTTPLGAEVLDLRAGDRVLLSGTIYTARDEAHLKILEEGFPFDPAGAVIYHCGPVVDTGRNVIVAAGPTTSARMNGLTAPMMDAGVRAPIGKGGMSAGVRKRWQAGRCILPLPAGVRFLRPRVWNLWIVIIRSWGWRRR